MNRKQVRQLAYAFLAFLIILAGLKLFDSLLRPFLDGRGSRQTSIRGVEPPDGFEVHGIDVSKYQSRIDWDEMDPEEVQFAFIKATEGTNRLDKRFGVNWSAAKAAGIRRGAYHFFRPRQSGTEQALFYLSAVDFEEGDLWPVLDVEVLDGVSVKKLQKEVKAWLQTVENRTGKKAIIYSGRKFYTDHLYDQFSDHPLWIAHYQTVEKPRGNWQFWQYTEKGRVKGIQTPVDRNVFSGSVEDLEGLCF